MSSGVVKWFNDEKGYGFIARADGSGDVFVHFREITQRPGETGRRTLAQGALVEFDEASSEKGPEATNVIVQ